MKKNVWEEWNTQNVTDLVMQVVDFTGLMQVCRQVASLSESSCIKIVKMD